MYPDRLAELKRSQESRVRNMAGGYRSDPTFLPVLLTGGIGDALLSITTLRRLKAEGYQLFVASDHAVAFSHIYKDIPVHSGGLPDFVWRLEVDSIARFHFEKGFGGFLVPHHKALYDQHKRWLSLDPAMEYLVSKHPRDKFLLTKEASDMGADARTFPLLCLGFHGIKAEAPTERRSPSQNYITIHDGYDANYVVSGRATKTWKWEYWNSLVRLIRSAYPGTEIIQVGSKNSRLIDGVTTQKVNQTSIPEALDIISASKVHIDTDSGLVHAATAMGVPCVVMFGPTPKEFYGHPQNINISRETSCSGNCFHLTRNWMDKCPIGYDSPRCMDDIGPMDVMTGVVKAFS